MKGLFALGLTMAVPAAAQEIALRPGLSTTWVGAVSSDTKTIVATEPGGGFRFRYVLDRGSRGSGVLQQTVNGGDLERSRVFKAYYTSRDSQALPNATAMVVSRALLRDLRSGRPVTFTVLEGERREGVHVPARRETATVRRERGADGFATEVDGRLTTLPAIVASGQLAGRPYRVTILDSDAAPLVLETVKNGRAGGVTRIRTAR